MTYDNFLYAPFLLVGLLRYRLVEPRALIAGSDRLADKFKLLIENALLDLKELMKTVRSSTGSREGRRYTKYINVLRDILEELSGEGINPNLLLDIYNLK